MRQAPGHQPRELAARLHDWRPGIALQLGIAFVGVAVLAAVANFVVQRTVSVTATRIIPPRAHIVSLPSPPPSAVQVPERSRVDGSASLPVLERLEDAVLVGSGLSASERTRRLGQAADELRTVLKRLHGSGDPVDAARRTAEQIIEIDTARQQAFAEHADVLAQLDARFREASQKSWKFLGRVMTPKPLVSADQLFQELRRGSVILRTNAYTPEQVAQLGALEAQFGAALANDERALVRSLGAQWHARTLADHELLRALRNRLLQLDAQRRETAPVFRAQAAQVRSQLLRPTTRAAGAGAASAQSLPKAPAEPPLFAKPPWELGAFLWHEQAAGERMAPRGVAWLSVGVLAVLLLVSVATVRSILLPVRRLIAATQRIAVGETGVRVGPQGSRELDRLARAFNQMAAELETAQAVALGYQQRLEARVAERTRQLQHQADHDSLTCLPNRRQLFGRLRSALERVSGEGGHVGLFFVDLDNFKTINDGRGHGFGDRVLVAVAERLAAIVGNRGVAARFGGDEFVVLAGPAGGEDWEQALCDLGRSLVQAFHRPLHLDGRELLVSVSVGAAFHPGHAGDPESLLSAADAALFRAKALGRSQMAVFTPELLASASARFTTEQALRQAVEREELELVFQPEVDLARLEVNVCEALLRWRRDGELVGPEHFLPIAEESGLIVEINDWVLRSAIAAAGRWRRNGHAGLRVAINASSRQLADPAFAERVAGLLLEHEVPPGALEIELTETVLQTGSSTIAGLRRLHEIGVTVALDDFGAGYSSLASLEQLPLDRVKLDRSLIAGIDSSTRSSAIANAIIQLCFDLDVQVTAEGVERPAQLEALRDSGITLQGFLLARPLPEAGIDEAVRLLPGRLQSLLLSVPAAATHASGAGILRMQVDGRRRRRRLGAPG